ncbi:MAG: hypothetical protein HKN75_05080 [Bacteroidia bacterium]|nr:hypothetical protein [Bacteroidia bacterium]
MNRILSIAVVLLILIASSSCRKESFVTDSSAKLAFSNDTVIFDTVFVTIGSTTQWLQVYNNNDKSIRISNINLAGGSASKFRINVDGLPGTNFSEIEINANDSMFIFVEVTIDPNASNLPFVVDDSITFETNGNLQSVKLVAWGQNANFIRADTYVDGLPPYKVIDCPGGAATWNSTLPYVIFGYAVVDSACTLNVDAGTQIHFYNNSGLWVYRAGTIKVNGTLSNPVVFQGTRLEPSFDEEPGQWDRIWINEGSVANEFNYAIIKNGFIGLQLEPIIAPSDPREIKVNNTVIRNMSGYGIFTRAYTGTFKNCMISNCGQYLAALTAGGSYDFRHCTFANYWTAGQRSTPSIFMNNFIIDENSNAIPSPLDSATFKNCIIYGRNDSEIEWDFVDTDSAFKFDYCLVQVDPDFNDANNPDQFSNILKNQDPGFVDAFNGDYFLDTLSVCEDAGNSNYVIPDMDLHLDLVQMNRLTNLPPDLGAVEYTP